VGGRRTCQYISTCLESAPIILTLVNEPAASSGAAAGTVNITCVQTHTHEMTHVPKTGAINHSIFRRRFLVRVSCISGTGFVWYQIPAPIRTLLFQARKWRARDSNDDLRLVLMYFQFSCYDLITNYEFVVYTSLSAMFIFGTRNLHSHMVRKNRRRIWSQLFMAPVSGALCVKSTAQSYIK